MAGQHDKPLDARLACALVRPLRGSRVTPNHLTSVRLAFGLAACAGLARGDSLAVNLGALCFAVSHFLDHADGELARLSATSSRFGHYYDLVTDALVTILMFCCLGIGLARQPGAPLAEAAIALGITAGVATAIIFQLRDRLERQWGRAGARQPHTAHFEAEDVLYLLPVITWLDLHGYFLLLAALGAPLFAVYALYRIRAPKP